GLSVRNDGPMGVTITGIGESNRESDFPFVQSDVLLGDVSGEYRYSVGPGHSHPFRPFSLGSGEERAILVRGTLEHCAKWSKGGFSTYGQMPVTFRVFGITRHAVIYLDESYAFTPDPSCANS